MSTSPQFTSDILAEKIFYADAYKTFSLAATRVHWTSPFGHHSKDGFQFLRYKYDTVNNSYKVVGRVIVPKNIWDFFCLNIANLTFELYQRAGVKEEPSAPPPPPPSPTPTAEVEGL